MFRHDTQRSEAIRCRRLAALARAKGDEYRALKLEARAAKLEGQHAPLRAGRLASLLLAAIAFGACAPKDAYENAMARSRLCPDTGTAWVERTQTGEWIAVCGTPDGAPLYGVLP